jgi:hypothetical protein
MMRLVFPGGEELWVEMRYPPRVGEYLDIYSSAAQCARFPAMGPTCFVVTGVMHEMNYSSRDAGEDNLVIYLEIAKNIL